MTGESEHELRSYLAMDEDVLFEALGDLLLGDGPGFGGPSNRAAREQFAQAWLARKADDFRRDICGHPWLEVQRRNSLDAMEDAAIIADALAMALGHPMANLVAVILLRRGLDKICG
jgi:hypothetical protein